MELVLAYGAGVLTLINPCILPIVLAGALQASRWGPLALAAGMGLAFVTLGFAVIAAGHLIGLTEEMVARAGAVLMIVFGLILLIPQASARFATATAGFAERADTGLRETPTEGWQGQLPRRLPAGAIWSPCPSARPWAVPSSAAQPGDDLVLAGLSTIQEWSVYSRWANPALGFMVRLG